MESASAIEATIPYYRSEANAIVHEMLGDVEVSVDVVTSSRIYGPVILVTVPMDRFALRLYVEGTDARQPPCSDFRQKLRKRIDEARTHGERFVARMSDVRAKIEACLIRNGGMDLVSLEMTADRLIEPFHWYEGRLDARIRFLGVLLTPETDVIDGFTARAMAGTIRSIGKDHQRRIRIRDRLASIGAVCEVDLLAERHIIESGRTVGEIVSILAEQRHIELEGPTGFPVPVSLLEGRVCLHSMPDNRVKPRPVTPNEI